MNGSYDEGGKYDAGYGQHKYLYYHEHSDDCEWKSMECTCGLWDELDTSAVEPLIKDLELHGKHIDEGGLHANPGGHYPARAHLVGALGKIGDIRAVEPLIKVLERIPDEKNSEIVWITVDALAMIGDDRAYEPIIQTLGYSQEDSISFWLGGGKPKGYRGFTVNADALARALGDSVEAVRSFSAEILDELNWKPETEKQQIDYWIAKHEWGELITLGEPAIPSLVKALKTELHTWEPAVSRSGVDYARTDAAHALGKIGDERGVESLIEALRNKYPLWRSKTRIANSLGDIGDARAVIPLIELFIKLPYPSEKSDEREERKYVDVTNALKKLPGAGAELERLELYDKAEEFYNYHNMLEEAAAIRRKKADIAAPKTVVQGDYVDDRDTIVKDSVISKSNVGSGGKSKAEKLREVKALLDDGIINDDDYEKMKREIIG